MDTNIFEEAATEYDEWFVSHTWVYQSEVAAVRKFVPKTGEGIEIGIGIGRFSTPFGIKIGIEPAMTMAEIARKRGIHVYVAKAEDLPFRDNSFDFALMVTTLCFLENPFRALQEIRRILKPAGKVIIGMLDEECPLGMRYREKTKKSKFYKNAKFYPINRVLNWLRDFKFGRFKIVQTIFKNPDKIQSLEPIEEDFGKGLFVVIAAEVIK
ncbi:MAG: class I SAM-dependent methyltransferase [Candidatus Brocadia sp.]|jgi:ubiquinone/menaquinone biosynthesis C-methylase UbiE